MVLEAFGEFSTAVRQIPRQILPVRAAAVVAHCPPYGLCLSGCEGQWRCEVTKTWVT